MTRDEKRTRAGVRIEIIHAKDPGPDWALDLAARLAQRPDTMAVLRAVPVGEATLPGCVAAMLRIERALGGAATPSRTKTSSPPEAAPDLVIDLAGAQDRPETRRWRVTFDGGFGAPAALASLLAGRMPWVEVTDETGAAVAAGRPGSETPGAVPMALDDVLARTATLIAGALDGAAPLPLHGPEQSVPKLPGCGAAARRTLRLLAGTAKQRLYRSLYRAPHWRTGWRFVDGPGVVERHDLDGPAWQVLPDDGFHFYADPFPIEVEGRTHLFVEDFDHRLGRGIISAVAFGPDGPVGTPHPVLDTGSHLSYPFVFEAEGAIWMVPESVAAGTIDLYRAMRFPDAWSHERTLVSGLEASDATLFRHDGRWWMAATVRDGGSFSDALHLWSATSLHDEWRPHRRNPVLVDISAARPAGRVIDLGGRLVRPVQDGRRGYGAALALAEITRLDDDGFAQDVVARLGPGPAWPGRRLHTLNRTGRLECIDGSALAPRLPFLPR